MSLPATPKRRSGSRLFLVVLALLALHAAFLILGRRAPSAGFLAGMLLDELLLLVGAWRLAAKVFPSPRTRFFVAVAALGSSLGLDADALRVATLPLILVLLHEALETPARAPAFLAGSLLLLQSMGRSTAMALAIPAAIALYGMGAAFLFGYPLRSRLRERAWGLRAWIFGALLIGLMVFVSRIGEPRPWSSGRPFRFLDLAFGISPSPDAACFCGFLTLAFAGLGLSRGDRKQVFGLLAVALLCLLSGLAPLLGLLVVFLAGWGFQGMLDGAFRGSGAVRASAFALALLSLTLAALAEMLLVDPAALRGVTETLALQPTSKTAVLAIQRAGLASDLAGISALMAALASGVLFLWNSGRRAAPLALGLALFLHPLDLFGWKFRMTWLNAAPGIAPPMPRDVAIGLLLLGIVSAVTAVWEAARFRKDGAA